MIGAESEFGTRARRLANIFCGDDPAARLSRRLVPIAIVVPVLLAAARLAGENAGLFSSTLGVVLVACGGSLIMLTVIGLSVHLLRRETARGAAVASSFQAVAEASLEAIVTADERGRIMYFNPAAERIFRHAARSVVGQELKILMPERYRERHQAGLERFLATGERRVIGDTIELTGVRSDGEEFPISLSLVDWEVDGRVFFTGTITDITRRKAAERKLAESARLFELINDLVATCGFDGYFKQLNGAWEAVLGWTPEELLPNPFIGLVHPDDRDAVDREVAKLAAGGTTAAFKIRVRTKDGGWRWTEWSASPDLPSQRFHCVGREITERVEVERTLAAERRQLADAQQLASVGSWELDVTSGYRTWSEQNFRNHGFDPSEPIPTFEQVLERIHPDDQVAVLRRMAEIEAGTYEFEYSYRLVLPDGRVREIEAEGRPFVEADGSVRVMGTTRDVTAERDAERLKDDFFGLVSHELRTPLTSIIGYAELLTEIEAENLSEQGRRFVEVIERNSRRELSLVGDLLLLTRITAGTFEIEISRADLGELVVTSAEAAEPDLAKAGIEIALDLGGAPVIDGDPHRLGQVIDNLLSNAIKFTPRGGKIEVRVASEGDRAVLAVADTGMGIPPQDTERLFDRMFRAREAERRHIQGTGLGLTIVKAIVDAHHGEITVDSDLGRGTTFRIALPMAAQERTEPADAGAPTVAEPVERD
jgi:PAS domain S-box-containing protein